MNRKIQTRAAAAVFAAASLVVLSACSGSTSDDTAAADAPAETTEEAPEETTEEAPDDTSGDGAEGDRASDADKLTAEDCGPDPIRIAHVDGFGSNTWRKTVRAELADELAACDVTIEYTDSGGDLQKYISAINSAAAQGYDIVLTFNDFGGQALSALQNAKKAGAVVATYVADTQGVLGEDYDVFVPYGFEGEGNYMAEWLAERVGPDGGNLLFTGGLEGGSVPTVALYDFIKAKNAELGSPLETLTDLPVPSGWDPAVMQKSMEGALAQFDTIDAYASDYGFADLGAIRAVIAAGRDLPPWATSATTNELGCLWLENNDKYPNWDLLTMDGTTSTVRTTIRKAMAKHTGAPDTYPNVQELIPFIDTANGVLPVCRDDLPLDADLSANLTQEQLQAIFNN